MNQSKDRKAAVGRDLTLEGQFLKGFWLLASYFPLLLKQHVPFKNPRIEGTSLEPVMWFSWPPTDILATSYGLKLLFTNVAEPLKNQLGLLVLPT